MSRVGKNPVSVPSGVTVSLAAGQIKAKGKLGELAMPLSGEVEVTLEDNKVWVKPVRETKQARMMWGTTRNLVRSMLTGVSRPPRIGPPSGLRYVFHLGPEKLRVTRRYFPDIETADRYLASG